MGVLGGIGRICGVLVDVYWIKLQILDYTQTVIGGLHWEFEGIHSYSLFGE